MAVAYDTVSPSAAGQKNDSNGSALANWNHTVSGTNPLLLVFVGIGGREGHSVASTTVAVNFGPTGLDSLAKVYCNNNSVYGFIQVFYKTGLSGTQAVSVTPTGNADYIEAAAITVTGVDQSTPLGAPATNYGSGSTASFTSAIASATDNMVAAFEGSGSGNSSTVTNATERFDIAFGSGMSSCTCANGATAPGAATVNPSFTITNDWWAVIGVDIKAAAAETGKSLADGGAAADSVGVVAAAVFADGGVAADGFDGGPTPSGPYFGSTATDLGDGVGSWVNPSNALADDGSVATWTGV